MENKKPNLLQRKVTGAIKPQSQYVEDDHKTNKSKSKGNQKKSFKISEESYKDFVVIKNMDHMKFDYEVVQMLIDAYYKSLSPDDQRRFNVIRENI